MRLAGRQKLGYYPLPPVLAGPVARLLTTAGPAARLRLLDPCCGEGTALKLIAEETARQHTARHGRFAACALSTWGIELDQVRAKQAAGQLDHVLAASYFATTLSTGSGPDQGWQLAYVNSIYDEAVEALDQDEQGSRQEVQFLKRTTDRLCDFGIMIWVIPQHVLGRRGVATYLAEHYDRHCCYRFPDATWRPPGSTEDVGMYAQFKQIVWLGRKLPDPGPAELPVVAQIEAWVRMGEQLSPLPLQGNGLPEPYVLPNAPASGGITYFVASSFDPDAAAARVGAFTAAGRPAEGVWANEAYWSARFPPSLTSQFGLGHPLHALKRGYVIAFAVAGLVNRAILVGKSGRRLLVKGHTRKVVQKRTTDDGIEIVVKETEQYESSLWGLDLDSMQLVLIEVGSSSSAKGGMHYKKMTMKEFLAEFGDSLMEQVQQSRQPRYQGPHQVPWARAAFAYLKRRPLGRQLDAILAQVHALVNRSPDPQPRLARLAEVAEMGAGKTYVAIATAFLADLYACGCAETAPSGTRKLHLFPLIVLSPPVMAPKWKREVEETLPAARVLIIERFGPQRGRRDEDDEDEDHDLRAAEASASMVGGQVAFRQFDPSFAGEALGVVGSLDQAVACIRRDLDEWRTRYTQVLAHNRGVRAALHTGQAQESDLWPIPLKPTHIMILTFHVARTMPAWMPVWRMKAARIVDRQTGKMRLLRRRGEKPEDCTPIFFPACPSCLRLAKDDQAKGVYATTGLFEPQSKRSELAEEGREKGLQLLAAEERLRHYLLTIDAYAVLAREEAALRDGEAPSDEEWIALERALQTHLESLPDYQRLRTERMQAEEAEEGERAREATRRLEDFVLDLPVHDLRYRELLCHQDWRFRALQYDLRARMGSLREQLAQTDETYQHLLQEVEAASGEWRRHHFRVAAYEAEAREATASYLTEAALRGKKDYRIQHRCTECGEPLWQYVSKAPKDYQPYSVQDALPLVRTTLSLARSEAPDQYTSSRRVEPLPLPDRERHPKCVTATWRRPYALGRYLARRYPDVFGLLISDEVHEGADKTALSRARERLAQACGQMLGLTGTLSNGYASSLFRLYYTLMPGVRREFAYDDTRRWIGQYGKMQTITKSRYKEKATAKGVGAESDREIEQGMPVTREIPGFNATGLGRVAQVSSLTELSDVVKNLVPYREEVRTFSMGDGLKEAYQEFQTKITRKMRDLLHSGDNSGLSPWYHALMTVGDLPWQEYICQTKSGERLGVFRALPAGTVWPIETALIQYVQEQHLKGHRVLVFTEHTGDYDEQPRIKGLLERYVYGRGGRRLRVEILRSTSTKRTMDREAWLARAVERGVEVLICNPRLVKVGLDLLAFPKIVYKSFPDKVTDFRQSARRSWRPGQTEAVEVVILCYEEALSLRLLYLMARKTAASLMVEGHIASEGLVSLGFEEEAAEGDLVGELAREMLKELETGTLNQTGDLAAEVQQLAFDTARLEADQQQRLGEEADATTIFLEEIRQVPLVLPPPLPPLDEETAASVSEAAPEQSDTSLVESVQDKAFLPDLVPTVPDAAPVPVSPSAAPASEPAAVPMVTIVPMPITTTTNPILAEAGTDEWAELRKLFGVGGKKRKITRKR